MASLSEPNETAPSGQQPTVASSGPSSSSSSSPSNFVLCDQHRTESGYPIPSDLLANGTSRDEAKSIISSLSVRESALFDRETTLRNPYWTQERYDELRPVFKLATILLEDERYMPFLGGLFTGAKKACKDRAKQLRFSARYILIEREKWFLRRFFGDLAKRVIIEAGDLPLSLDAETATFEFESQDQKTALFPEASSICGTSSRPGRYSLFGADEGYYAKISISKEMVDKACAWDTPGRTVEETRLRYLRLASTIVHELMHAACNFFSSLGLYHDPYFEDECAAEIGFAWETFVFGGIIRSSEDYRRLFMDRWPGQKVFDQYFGNTGSTMIYTEDDEDWGLDRERACYVPDEEWLQLLSDGYWSGAPTLFSECCYILDADQSTQGRTSSTGSDDLGSSESDSQGS